MTNAWRANEAAVSRESLDVYLAVSAVFTIGGGLYALLRSPKIADRNREYIASGEETYFEERRSWEHYGAPPTDPNSVRRGGYIAIAFGTAGLLLVWFL